MQRADIRNVAIVAHVDHGKTTLVDAMLHQCGAFRANQEVVERVLDSMDLEREKGITILAKNTSVRYGDLTINIVDTPGHADFGGEVERALSMVDGVLLMVDASEGPLPQTRFVLRKALEARLPLICVLNKMDRQDARPIEVLDAVYELFIDLGATDDQIDFPVVYCNAREGKASVSPEELAAATDLKVLFELLVAAIPPPAHEEGHPFQAIVTNLDASPYLGRLALCRVRNGTVRRGQVVSWCRRDGSIERVRLTGLYMTEGLQRVEAPPQGAGPGDIIAVAGIADIMIGDTLTDPDDPRPLPTICVEEPSISMTIGVNTSPLAGKSAGGSSSGGGENGRGGGPARRSTALGIGRGGGGAGASGSGSGNTSGTASATASATAAGTKLTARLIKSRLDAELVGNVSLRVFPTERPDMWEVQGRGELALAVLVETMRREGFELTIGKPQVLTRRIHGQLHEPVERVSVDVPEQFTGAVTQLLSIRKGRMVTTTHYSGGAAGLVEAPAADLPMSSSIGSGTWCRMEWIVPSRGLIGFRMEFLTETRGSGLLHHVLEGYEPWHGEIRTRQHGVLVADRRGRTTVYALLNLQERGTLFVGPGVEVYEGMIVGKNARAEDMDVNPTKEKKLTNMRAAAADETVRLAPPLQLTLEQALEFIRDDECVEVTPTAIRLRKVLLERAARGRQRAGTRSGPTQA